MSLDRVIRESWESEPEKWAWNGRWALIGPGIRLELPCGEHVRWSVVVGDRIGHVELSALTHLCIETAWALAEIPDLGETRPTLDPERASPYGVGNGPAPERDGRDRRRGA